jgi:lysophospholipase L1-like esterase
MKHVLCFGDSNTYGFNPRKNGIRFDFDVRWTGILQRKLGGNFRIIEEGYNGRTILTDDFMDNSKSSRNYIVPCILSHRPLDLIVLCLGTNDLKRRFDLSAMDLARQMKELISIIRNQDYEDKPIPEILLMSPIELGDEIALLGDGASFDSKSVRRSKELPKHYEELAKTMKCRFFAASSAAAASKADHIHLDEAGHAKLADALVKEIEGIFAV